MRSYFELLNIEPAFDIDLAALEKAYFAEQRKYHPDRFAGKSSIEKQAALQRSVDLNAAYEALKEPLSRAQYLLHVQGIEVGTDHDTVKPSQTILIETMELRETPPEKKVLANMIAESIADIARHYGAGAFDAMAQETIRLGYLAKARAS